MNVSVQYQIRGDSSNLIAASIENGIRGGKLSVGERLPTVRALAGRLRVSPTTVAAAYNALRVRGLVHGSGRRGTVVNRRPPLLTRAVFPPPAVGLRNLADGGPDPALLPRLKPYLARLDGIPGKYGDAENRAALVKLAARQFKSDGVAADSIAVVSGALDGIERVLQAHLRPGDLVAVEDPSYTGVLDLVAALALVTEPVAIDDSGPNPADLKRALKLGAKAFILTPRAQNPSGAALDRKRAAELRQVLAAFPEVVLIEDDHAGPVSGAPAITLSGGRAALGDRALGVEVARPRFARERDGRRRADGGAGAGAAESRPAMGQSYPARRRRDDVGGCGDAQAVAKSRRYLCASAARVDRSARESRNRGARALGAERVGAGRGRSGGGKRDGGERMGDSRGRVLSNQKCAGNPRDGINPAARRRAQVRCRSGRVDSAALACAVGVRSRQTA